MLPEEQIQRMEAWLDGTLSPADQADFETRLKDEPGLADALSLLERLRKAAREDDPAAFRQTVEQLLREHQNRKEFLP